MKRVLFVCVHNAGRSVMAEAFFNAEAPEGWEALSAGTEPAGGPHPEVVSSMREAGFEVGSHRGVLLSDDIAGSAKHVVTMGCAVDSAVCPAIRYADVEDWGLPDPKGKAPDEVAAIRDRIRDRVRELIQTL